MARVWFEELLRASRPMGARQYVRLIEFRRRSVDSPARAVSEKQVYISHLMREDFCRLAESVRPLILTAGNTAEDVDKWITNATAELRNLSKHMYVNVSRPFTRKLFSLG